MRDMGMWVQAALASQIPATLAETLCPTGAFRAIFHACPFTALSWKSIPVHTLQACLPSASSGLISAPCLGPHPPPFQTGTFIYRVECPASQAPGCLAGPACDVCSLAFLPCAFRDPGLGRGGVSVNISSHFLVINHMSSSFPSH